MKKGVLKKLAGTSCGALMHILTVAQERIPPYRKPGDDTFRRILDNPDFQYQKPRQGELPFLDRLAQWWNDLLRSIFGSSATGDVMEFLFYAIGVVLIVYALIRIFDIKPSAIFKRSPPKSGGQSPIISDTRIPQTDLIKMIEEARKAGDFRKVVELQYILCLKRLSEAEIIELEESKTNLDYLYEISDAQIKPAFRELSRIFEYTWYGNFKVTTPILQKSDRLTEEVSGGISNKR